MYSKVLNFNVQFGVKVYDVPQEGVFEEDTVEFCLKLIREEVRELEEAVEEKDYIETIDALADIVYVVLGMGTRMGIWIDDTYSGGTCRVWIEVFDEEPCLVEYCVRKVVCGLGMLEEMVDEKDMNGVGDCLLDLFRFALNMGNALGVDMERAFDLVHENNMSKLCNCEEEAKRTVEYYELNKDKLGYDSPSYRLAPDGVHWVVFNMSTKKILKSISWKPVDLRVLIE